MNKYEEIAADIIDMVSDVVEIQHPEIKLKNNLTKEIGIENPAVIVGDGYYNLELEIASKIKNFKLKNK